MIVVVAVAVAVAVSAAVAAVALVVVVVVCFWCQAKKSFTAVAPSRECQLLIPSVLL